MKNISVFRFLIFFAWLSVAVQAEEIALPEIGDSAGSLISPQEEYQIGLGFFWRLQQSVDLIDDAEVNSYIQSLGYRLVSYSDAPHLPFTFFMVPKTSINAFAAPGGFIGVHSGLFLESESEDEVASVLAHEIAHITQRHLLRRFERTQQMSIPMTVAMIAAALLGAADPSVGSAAIMAVQAGSLQAQLNFSRTHETEADNLGMQTLVKAGFDPMAMPRFFERLQKSSRFYTGSAVPEFLRTHPVTLSRIAEARGRAVKYPLKRRKNDSLQFYLMREKLRVMAAEDLHKLIGYYADTLRSGSNINEKATHYGYSLALTAMGDYAKARQVLQPLIDDDVDRLSYQIALAKIEVAVGRLSAALSIYDAMQKIYPDDQALSFNHVDALLRAKLPERASELLFKQLELGVNSRKIYKLLAQAMEDMGEKSQAHSWLAEYYYSLGRLRQAADQLHIAADFAAGDEFQLAKISARLRNIDVMLEKIEEL